MILNTTKSPLFDLEATDSPKNQGRFSVRSYHAPDRYLHLEDSQDLTQPGLDPETTEILMADRVATGG